MAQRHELVLRFEAFPEVSLSLVLLRGVKNHAALQQAMLGGELDCAFICPALVRDPFLIHTAAYAALCAHSNNKLRTRNIHSELVVSLSPTRNITKSLSAFGRVGSDMIVGVFSLSSQKMADIVHQVEGEPHELSKEVLHQLFDAAAAKKLYAWSAAEEGMESFASGDPILDAMVLRLTSP